MENFQDEIIKRSKESNSSYFDIKNPEKILQEKNVMIKKFELNFYSIEIFEYI